jgi:hypothetical protein
MFSKRYAIDRSVTAKFAWIAAAAVVIPSWHGSAFSADARGVILSAAQVSQAHAGVSRDPIRSAMERLSEGEIKSFYVRCSQEAVERRLDGAEATMCSVGYDVLLKKHFSGNFDLLLAWSRAQQIQGR